MPDPAAPGALPPRALPEQTPPIAVVSAAWADAEGAELAVTLEDGRTVNVPALDDDPTFQRVLAQGMQIAPFARWPDLAAVKAAVKAEAGRRIEAGPSDWRMIRAMERGEDTAALSAQREAIRSASDVLEATVASAEIEALAALDVGDDAFWPEA